jgi:hypothetical protein
MIPVVVGIISVSGLAAYAYWTATGSGTGTATASTGATVTLTATVASGLAPGIGPTVTIKATPSTTQAIRIGTVRLTNVTVDAGHSTGCDKNWFTMADVAADEAIPAGGGQYTLIATGTLQMSDLPATNQDACKGATLTLDLTT